MFQDSIPLRMSLVALVLACVFTASQAWALFAPESAPFFEAAQAQQAEGCRVVEEFTGQASDDNEETTTPAFDISGERFLVESEAVGNGPPGVGLFLGVLVRDENGNLIDRQIIDRQILREEGSETLSVNDGPGRFTLQIFSANVDYTITVRDCAGDTPNPPGGDRDCPDFSSRAAAQAVLDRSFPEDPERLDADADGEACEEFFGGSEPPLDPPQPPEDPGRLARTGGPEHGPFPLMPNGECPKGFRVERDGACYRS